MSKSAKDVIASVPKEMQIKGMTRAEILTAFTMAGYGVKKAIKRTKELIVSAQLQSDGTTDEGGRMLFWSPYWPYAWKTPIGSKLRADLICAVEYYDPRHEVPIRADGRENAWLLE